MEMRPPGNNGLCLIQMDETISSNNSEIVNYNYDISNNYDVV